MKKKFASAIILKTVLTVLFVCVLFLPPEAVAKRAPAKKTASPQFVQTLAPSLIAGTRPEMNSPGFWIGLHPFPDGVILDREGIRAFNRTVQNELKISYDLTEYPATYPGEDLVSALKQDYSAISGVKLYLSSGAPVNRDLLLAIRENMNIKSIPPEIAVRFGFAVKGSDKRSLPLSTGLYQARVSRNFDRLQISSIELGTPLAILHSSADRKWRYVVAPYGEGWVEESRIVECPFEIVKKYLQEAEFAVITAVKADIYLNSNLTRFYDRAKMGSRFQLLQEHGDKVEIRIPGRGPNGSFRFQSGFIRKKDVNRGYLAYTPRNILLQAFEFLNEPYGWGDMNGDQDCSSFIRSVFATVGIELPRNSQFQSKTGKSIGAFDRDVPLEKKLELLVKRGVGGITLLRMTGHIMLYVGAVDGTPYAIHGIYGYHDMVNRKETVKVINRIVITDLFLGNSTRLGPFIKRIDTVKTIE